MTTFLPNSFQMPNSVIDVLMPLLTDSEFRVLCWVMRHVMGWTQSAERKCARIAQSLIENGYTWTDGKGKEHKFAGCGVKRGAIKASLRTLEKYRIIAKRGKLTNDGYEWELTLITQDDVDVTGLTLRYEGKSHKAQKQTKKARDNNPKNTPGLSVQQTHLETAGGDCPTDPQGICSTDGQGDCPTDPKEYHKEQKDHYASEVSDAPAIVVDGIVSHSQKVEILANAIGIKPVTKRDFGLYGSVVKTLDEASIKPDEYALYVRRVKAEAVKGKWKFTVPSLISNNRPSEYVSARNEHQQKQPANVIHVYKPTAQDIAEAHMLKMILGDFDETA